MSSIRYVRSGLKIGVLGITIAFLSGCFSNPGNDKMAASMSKVSLRCTASGLAVSGPCFGNTSVVFTYSSALSSQVSTEVSCVNDQIPATKYLSINNPTMTQTFKVSVVGRMKNKQSTPYVVNVTCSNTPPTPGFAVTSGGGTSTGAVAQITSYIGEPASSTTQPWPTSGSSTLRPNVSGVVNYP